jgi:hypothetical protein
MPAVLPPAQPPPATLVFHHCQRDAHRACREHSTGVRVKYKAPFSAFPHPSGIARDDHLTRTFRREIPARPPPRVEHARCQNMQSPWRALGLRTLLRTLNSSGAVRADPRPCPPPPHTSLARSLCWEHMWLTGAMWFSEIEDMLRMPAEPTLDMLDTALNRFITFCASYHGECEVLRLLHSTLTSK